MLLFIRSVPQGTPHYRRGWKIQFSFSIFIAELEREKVIEPGQSAESGRDFKSSKSFYSVTFLKTSPARVNSQAELHTGTKHLASSDH